MSICEIPQIIMQTWKNRNIPDEWKPSVRSIKKHMPRWKYVLMTDKDNEEFVKHYFPDFYKYYKGFEYNIMRVDAIRYMWLYVHGGIYMDMDIALVKPLDDLFWYDSEAYLVSSGNMKVYTNSFMASKPKSHIWLECLKEMTKPYSYWMIGKHLKVMGTTGPLMLTRVVKKTKTKVYDLPAKKLMPCSLCDPKPCTKPGAYTKALEGSSWCGWDSYIYGSITCNWKLFLLIIITILLIVIYFWSSLKV